MNVRVGTRVFRSSATLFLFRLRALLLPAATLLVAVPNAFAEPPSRYGFYTLSPCRVVDTRDPAGPYGGPALAANSARTFVFWGRCGIPSSATAIALNGTATGATAAGNFRIYPGGAPLPTASSLNYKASLTRANNGSYKLGGSGDLTVRSDQPSGSAHLILDVSGYYETSDPPPPPPPPTATPTPAPPPPTATPTPIPVPAAASNLTAAAVSSSQINVAWTDASTNETGFKIERSTSTTPWSQIGTVGANVTSYASTGLTASTIYSYRVRAYNGSGDSGYSNTASATTQSGGGGGAWTKWYAGAGSFGDSGRAVAVDSTGNVAVAGQFQGIVNFGTGSLTSYTNPTSGPTVDAFVAKYSPSGTPVWSRGLGGNASDSAAGVSVDPSGNVVVTGYQASTTVDYGAGLLTSLGVTDIFIAKYSSATGAHLWSKTVGGTGADSGTATAQDSGGGVLVTGYFSAGSGVDFGGGALTSAGAQDVFLVKYSSAGAHVWSKRFGGSGYDQGIGVAVDGAGNVAVMGISDGTIDLGGGPLASLGGRDLFVAKFSPTGQHLWSRRFGGTGTDNGRGIAVDGAGDVFVTGDFVNSISFGGPALTSAGREDIFLAKLSEATGGHLWSRRFGNLYSTEMGFGVAVDGSNNVAITGFFAEDINFGGGTIYAQLYDIFVAKFNSTGAHISSRRYGDPPVVFNNQYGNAIAMSSGGNIFLTGSFLGTLDFGAGGQATSTPYGGSDAYLAHLGP